MKQDHLRMKLRMFMSEKEMSQDRMAQLLGTNKFTLSRWMTGKSKPSPAYTRVINEVVK